MTYDDCFSAVYLTPLSPLSVRPEKNTFGYKAFGGVKSSEIIKFSPCNFGHTYTISEYNYIFSLLVWEPFPFKICTKKFKLLLQKLAKS